MASSPETATAYGDYRYNDRLNDYSLQAARKQFAVDRSFRERLAAIAPGGFPDQDHLSHDLLLQELDNRIRDYSLKLYEMPISQMSGIQTDLADLPNAVPLDTLQHYQEYIARLHQIPRAVDQIIEVLQQGKHDGLMPPQVLLKQIPTQCHNTIAEDPFLVPTKSYPASITPADQRRLSAQIEKAVRSEVLPAFRRFSAFIATDYAPHGRTTIGMSSLPSGTLLYQNAIREQTTTEMTAAEIYALGLREVDRLNGLLTELAHRGGYADLSTFRSDLNSNPEYVPQSTGQILGDFRKYIAQMQSRLPELFRTVPSAPLTVEGMPPNQPGNISHHVPGTPDGRRPARVVVATSDFAKRKLLSDETISYHEGIPGHHLQMSIQQQLTGLPDFRQHITYNAYAEGWAVYTEALGREIGLFNDLASDYGRLNTELMRAVRMVVDTGIHADGWTRNQAVAYFRESGCADEPTLQAEVDRYIAWPAQGLSYKIGQITILELRQEAEHRLGSSFDIRSFHDEILSGGSLPLNVLRGRMNNWIQNQQSTR